MTPPTWRQRATSFLGSERELLLTDLVVAETVYVLESFYEAPRDEVADAVRSLVAFGSIVCVDPALLLRAIEVYETDRIDFAEAYLVACAESTGVGKVASFDRSIDRVRHDRADRAAAGLTHVVSRLPTRRGRSPMSAARGQACVESSRGCGGSRWNADPLPTRALPANRIGRRSERLL